MRLVSRLALFALLLASFALQALAGDVFALPASQFDPGVPVYASDGTFTSLGTAVAAPQTVAVLAKPDGSKFYVVSGNPTSTVVVFNSSLAVVASKDLGQPATAAALSPDGTRLLVLAGQLHVYNTSDDSEITLTTPPSVGSNPLDLAFSLDSRRAFILSGSPSQLTIFDLSTNVQVGSPTLLPGTLTGVGVAPNGLVYVAGTLTLYEIDGATGAVRASVGLNGTPGKPVFSPDGRYALLKNLTPASGVAFLIDLQGRSLAGTIPNSGPTLGMTLDQLVFVDDNHAYGLATNLGRLVEISMNPFQAQLNGFLFDTRTGVMAVAASRELPAAQYVFAAASSTISRGVVATSQSQDLPLSKPPAKLIVAAPSSGLPPVSYREFNDNQTVLGSSTSLPLVLRVWDSNGIPAFNRAVTFSSTTAGVTIENPNTHTGADGFAATRVTAPSSPGVFTVSASVDGLAATITFTLTVPGGGGGGGGGGGAGISIYGGNGQALPLGASTAQPLQVMLKDAQGNPLSGQTINWAVTGDGILTAALGDLTATGGGPTGTSQTDGNGVAQINYVGPAYMLLTTNYDQVTVTASAANLNSVNFTVTTFPTLPDGNSAVPTMLLVSPPQQNRSISGQAGQTLNGAVQVQVSSLSYFELGQPVPGIGVEFVRDPNAATEPSAMCQGVDALTDATGVATCNVVLGGVTGTLPVMIRIGGLRQFAVLLTVTTGSPGLIQIQTGNNQSGGPGQTLPVTLTAQVSDGFGNILSGVPVTWTPAAAGTVSVTNASTVSDANGLVRATAVLGSTPGQVQLVLRAGSAHATFTFTVNVPLGAPKKISGDLQTAIVNTTFAQPLVIEVDNAGGAPVAGVVVSFAVASGSATVGSASATTDSQGRASTTVTAGSTAGQVQITASVPGQTALTFTLTVVPPGPVVSLAGIASAISGDLGVTPGGIVAIYGSGLAPGIQGSVSALGSVIMMPLPTTLANVQVLFGSEAAPIYSVNNVNGQEFVVVQAPFSLAAPGVVAVTIKVGGGSTVVNNVPVKAYQPGIFETGPVGGRYAILERPDGSFVGPGNAAHRGEQLWMFCSGLGQTTPAWNTNFGGIPGQSVLAPLTVGINNAGVAVVSAQTMFGMIGVYVVTFDVPANAPTGSGIGLVFAVSPPGGAPWTFSNNSKIGIQ